MKLSVKAGMIGAALMMSAPVSAATNIIKDNWSVISWPGAQGVLRAGSPWGPGSTASSATSPVDGVFAPTSQQWNNGSFWWDQDPTVNAGEVTWTVQLNQAYTVNRFVVQADDNDSYLVEYWDGANWLNAYTVAAVGGFGLQTRDSGKIGSITSDRFRFRATGGDNYYALSEFQAFQAVPEPSTWALLILGFGLVGGAMRSRKVATASYA